MQKKQAKPARPRIVSPVRFYTFVAIVVIIVAIVVAIVLQKSSVISITNPILLTLHKNQTLLLRLQNTTDAIYLANSNTTGALIYFGPMPFGLANFGELRLGENASVNLSSSFGSVADLNIKLVASNATSAKLYFTPIAAYLGIKPAKIAMLGPTPIQIEQGLKLIVTTSSTTTSTTTSTINYTSQLLNNAINYANTKTSVGQLLLAYKQLYIKDKVCNATVYNETFYHYYNKMPSGPQSFANMTKIVPISINETASQLYGNLVYVNFTPVLRNGTMHTPMFSMLLNLTPNAQAPIIETRFEGILFGDNYTILNATYQFQSRITNYCGAYIEPP
ncbi:MAG: hypothetical protein ACP5GD_01375 [Candidatus Micrarchaeia archaeon]|jgi:hypothetical protein